MPHAARAQIPQTVVAPVDDLGLVWSSCLFTVLGMGLVVAMAGHDANPIPAAAPAAPVSYTHLTLPTNREV